MASSLTHVQNLYGAFPFYVQMVNGRSHGVMMMNSNGMDISVASSTITFQMIGGIVDLYVFAGTTPRNVVDQVRVPLTRHFFTLRTLTLTYLLQYTQVVGRPAMMPYWSLGFHNCKYGYTSIWQV